MKSPQENDEVMSKRVREILDLGASHLDHRISVRLYESRCDALRHQTVTASGFSLNGVGTLVVGAFQRHVRIGLALVALAAGGVAVQIWQNDQQASELADIDIQLLSDEVPPSAYTDPGFQEWLQHLSESDDSSLPE